MAKKKLGTEYPQSKDAQPAGSVSVFPPTSHPSNIINDEIPDPVPGIPVTAPIEDAGDGNGEPLTADAIQMYIQNLVAKKIAAQVLESESDGESKVAIEPESVPVNINSKEFQDAVEAEVRRRLAEVKEVGAAALSGLDCTPVRGRNGNKLLMYVNRNPFPVYLPHPNDPGSSVCFPPCPSKAVPLTLVDFKTHPFYANFVGLKRSVSMETVPAYLGITEKDIEGSGTTNVHDLMKLSVDDVVKYVEMVSKSNPDIASQLSSALSVGLSTSGRRINQSPHGF